MLRKLHLIKIAPTRDTVTTTLLEVAAVVLAFYIS